MADLEIKIDAAPLLDVAADLGAFADEAPRVMSQAINATLTRGRTLVKRDVQEEITLNAGSIDSRMSIRRASPSNLAGAIDLQELRPPGLISSQPIRDTTKRGGSFGGTKRSRGSGVFVQVRKGEGLESHPRDFIAIGKGGVKQVFSRLVVNGKRVGRYPLFAVKGPSPIGLILRKPGFSDEVTGGINDILEQQADGAVAGFLHRKGLL